MRRSLKRRPRGLVALVGQHGQRVKLDPFLVQLFGLIGSGLTIDRAVLDLAVMHLARLFGKFLADIVGILCEVVAQLLQLRAKLAALRGWPGDWGSRPGGRRRGGRSLRQRRIAPLFRSRHPRRHDRLFDLDGVANRTSDEPRLGLLVVGCRVLEPTVECVPVVARQRVTDHAGPRTACRWAGSAIGPMISNRRPCWSDGIFARAAVTSAGSITARITPGSVSPSARMRPQGSTMREWPKVSRPFSCLPPCAAASTKAPFSIARARLSTCQCASPVCLVNAEGMARNEHPASASAR